MSRHLDAPARHALRRVPKGPVIAYGVLTLIWVVLWRFPVLMADDRFFAIASELPGGAQTWDGIVKTFKDCWKLINGRLVDGFGTVLFALGNTGIRLAMALFYVALTAMVWVYLRLAAEACGGPCLRCPGKTPAAGPGSAGCWPPRGRSR